MKEQKKSRKYSAIDLFSGGGGLSLGLEKAGFDVLLGVELNKEIAKTYSANHPNAKLLTKDIRDVTGKEIFKLVGKKEIDLIAGCPPCQGFSQLTEKYKRYDSRNDLALEMARLIVEIKPTMVMMENVPGIVTKGKSILDVFLSALKDEGYLCKMGVLQMADYGIPQSRRRFVLLAGKGFEIPLPTQTHIMNPDAKKGLKAWVPLARAIRKMPRAVSLSHAIEEGGPGKFNWHVVRNLTELSKQRLKAVKPGQNRSALPKRLRPDCHKEEEKGFGNVYGRLRWNSPSVTITSGCTTPCMGRFGHPSQLRTISIREAALIQTFPKNYKFKTQFMDYACDIVGNALPPKFAEIAGEKCFNAYQNFEKKTDD